MSSSISGEMVIVYRQGNNEREVCGEGDMVVEINRLILYMRSWSENFTPQ